MSEHEGNESVITLKDFKENLDDWGWLIDPRIREKIGEVINKVDLKEDPGGHLYDLSLMSAANLYNDYRDAGAFTINVQNRYSRFDINFRNILVKLSQAICWDMELDNQKSNERALFVMEEALDRFVRGGVDA